MRIYLEKRWSEVASVVLALTAILLVLAVPVLATAGEQAWPKAPFSPHLVYTFAGSEKLCSEVEKEAIKNFFAGYQEIEDTSEYPEKLVTLEPIKLNELPGLERALEYPDVYRGDITGDGVSDRVLIVKEGGANITNYRYYYRMFLLTDARISRLKELIEQSGDHYDAYRNFVDEIGGENFSTRGGSRPKPRNHPRLHRDSVAATEAYRMVDSTVIRSFEGRLYADVLVPDAEEMDRVILSFDRDMRPRAECIVAVRAEKIVKIIEARSERELKSPYILEANETGPYKKGALRALSVASQQATGVRSHCQRGTSKPFLYLQWQQDELYHNSLFRPWQGIGRFKTPDQFFLNHSRTGSFNPQIEKGRGHWGFNAFAYLWSLEGVFNRRAYRQFRQRSTEAIDQLTAYYLENFDVEETRARVWAGYYVFLLQSLVFDRVLMREEVLYLEKIYAGTASLNDFVQLARRQHDRNDRRLMPMGAENIPERVYTRAFLLAVGAGAPTQVLSELVKSGANLQGDEDGNRPLINAVDRPEILAFLLNEGAQADARNGFGKTALMTAAHMNREDSVRILLAAGADPNAQTWLKLPMIKGPAWLGEQPDCRYQGIRHRRRTPLMYAAENASLEVIELLLEAGADPLAQDSMGREIFDYLAMNKIVTVEERKTIRNMLETVGRKRGH